jgi:hypothetical protein
VCFPFSPETRIITQVFKIPLIARSTSLMQLIALIYKDQHVNKLERLLSDWLETSLSESSEDNESNTSPQVNSFDSSSPSRITLSRDLNVNKEGPFLNVRIRIEVVHHQQPTIHLMGQEMEKIQQVSFVFDRVQVYYFPAKPHWARESDVT